MSEDNAKSEVEFVTFSAGDQSFSIEITQVREIRRWSPVTALPHAPNEVLGVMNLRGSVIPIYDLAARFGGDEVALILPDTPPAGAEQLVQSLISRVRQLSIPVDKALHSKTRTTVTIGVCSVLPGPDDGPARLFEAADAALYQAKQAGRDGYRIAPPWPN